MTEQTPFWRKGARYNFAVTAAELVRVTPSDACDGAELTFSCIDGDWRGADITIVCKDPDAAQPGDGPHLPKTITVERAQPENWPPQPGDKWQTPPEDFYPTGVKWLATEPEADGQPWMYGSHGDCYPVDEFLRRYPDATLVHRDPPKPAADCGCGRGIARPDRDLHGGPR